MKIIPHDPNLTNEERAFNRRICSIRSLIERVIGVLKIRFRCLLGERQLRYNQTKVGQIVYACATMHNFLISKRFDIMHGINENEVAERLNDNNQDPIQNNVNNQINGVNRRNELIQFFRRQ